MSPATPSTFGVYVHFPWCVRKCPYCDFNSHARPGDEIPEAAYVTALLADLDAQLDPHGALMAGGGAASLTTREVASIFLGGGTPSLFAPRSIARVLDGLRAKLRFAADVEITMEANPGTLERGRFADYAAAGVNRVSLGAQTFSSAALTTLGRIHTPADTHRAAEELHAVGLDNFNLDLMYALPQQSVAEALLDVDTALALAPRQISHYQLTLEPNTPFAARPPAGMPEDELADEMFAACAARFAAAGLQRYEVSAHARTGSECRHNLGYWQFGDYLGLGAGAHGKWSWRDRETNSLLVRRSTQARDPRKFGRDPRATLAVRTVAAQELPFEFLLNALRLVAGTTRTTFEATTGLDWQVLAPGIARGFARGLLEGDPETAIRASPRGYAFLNDLLLVMHSD